MTHSIEDRLHKLEELCAHQSADIETLSDTVRQQWEQFDRLKKAFLQQRDRLTELEESGGGHENTIPPHY
jgi:uncharacterized coiled-coil protein SlyX